MSDEIDQSHSGSGVWEKSGNSRWVVVAETSHKIPRRTRTRTEGSVDPSLAIHNYINSFEIELPREGEPLLVNDGSSLVRLDQNVSPGAESDQPGPSRAAVHTRRLSSPSTSHNQSLESEQHNNSVSSRRSRRRHKNRKRKVEPVVRESRERTRYVCISAESSPGRDSPSPDSLTRIIHNNSNLFKFS